MTDTELTRREFSFGVARMPNEVIFGQGSLSLVPSAVAQLGRRPLVVADAFLIDTEPFNRMVNELRTRGLSVELFTDIVPELPVDCIAEAVASARGHGPDVIVGFGGGSSLDLAKVLSLMLSVEGRLQDYYGENKVPRGVLPVVAIPTTSGTGSEVTPVAVISDPERELKVGISSPHLVPQAAIIDPDVTHSCPPSVSAHSGIDALCHAIESLTSRVRQPDLQYPLPVFVGANALSIDASLRATKLIMANLARVVADGSDARAREAMSLGSLTAGIAFSTGGTHLGHAIQYPVGALTKTPHGLGVGLLLPYVLEVCAPLVPGCMVQLAEAMHEPGVPRDADPSVYVLRRIVELRRRIGIPHTLADIGVRTSDVDRLIELSLTVERLVKNAPGSDPAALVPKVVQRAMSGESEVF